MIYRQFNCCLHVMSRCIQVTCSALAQTPVVRGRPSTSVTLSTKVKVKVSVTLKSWLLTTVTSCLQEHNCGPYRWTDSTREYIQRGPVKRSIFSHKKAIVDIRLRLRCASQGLLGLSARYRFLVCLRFVLKFLQ